MAEDRPAIDHDMIRALAKLLDETGLTEIEVEREGERVRVARQAQPIAVTTPGCLAGSSGAGSLAGTGASIAAAGGRDGADAAARSWRATRTR